LAALQGHTSIVDWLATSCGADLTAVTSEGMAPLHFAALGGSVDTVEWIARAAAAAAAPPAPGSDVDNDGSDVDAGLDMPAQPQLGPVLAAPTGAGLTLMHLAGMKGHLALAQWLAGHGLDAGAGDPKGRTPLHLAVVGGHGDTVGWLVEAGANPRAADADGKTPLALAQAKAGSADAAAAKAGEEADCGVDGALAALAPVVLVRRRIQPLVGERVVVVGARAVGARAALVAPLASPARGRMRLLVCGRGQ